MLTYYKDVKNKNNTKNEYIVYKEVYNICISAINIMRPLNCMEIYSKYKAKRVLNFCSGWGGSTVAAAALNLDAHYGIEINTSLKEPYDKMVSYLKTKTDCEMCVFMCDFPMLRILIIANLIMTPYSRLHHIILLKNTPTMRNTNRKKTWTKNSTSPRSPNLIMVYKLAGIL